MQAINFFMPLSLHAPGAGIDGDETSRGGRRDRFQAGFANVYRRRGWHDGRAAQATCAKGKFRPTAGVPPAPRLRRISASSASKDIHGFGVLFLLLLVTAGWWLHSRW